MAVMNTFEIRVDRPRRVIANSEFAARADGLARRDETVLLDAVCVEIVQKRQAWSAMHSSPASKSDASYSPQGGITGGIPSVLIEAGLPVRGHTS
jgi:hypothetical protein